MYRNLKNTKNQTSKNIFFLSDMRVILSVSTSIKLMRMENGLNLLDYGRLRKAGNIVSYTHTGRTVNDAVL